MQTTFATVHEYVTFPEHARLAKVTCSFSKDHLEQEQAYVAVQAALGKGLMPIKASFRWLDESRRDSAIGFVYQPNHVEFIAGDAVPAHYRQIAGNIYMDENDKSMWDMKQGAGGKYLSRQGVENLSAMLETARVSPRGSQPRMSKVLSAAVGPRELVAFVDIGRRSASMDYGVVLSTGDKSTLVLSHTQVEPVTVSNDLIVASYQINSKEVPALPKERVDAFKKMKAQSASHVERQRAAGVYDPHLTPQEYWTLQYSYNQAYLDKVLKQVEEMAAL